MFVHKKIIKMSVTPFSELDVRTLVVKKPRANETAGKSAWIDRTSQEMSNTFSSKDVKVQWPIRPGSTDGSVKPFERLNLEIGCSLEDEKVAKECDQMFLKALYEMKLDFFGSSKSKTITSVESLLPIYKPLLREGGDAKDGSKYANSLRLKVDGWSKYIENVNVVEKVKQDGEKLKVVKDCDWKPRLVDSGDAPSDRDTHFLLFLGNNPETGKPRYSDKVVVLDDHGKPLVKEVSKDGKTSFVMRYVGPQDAVPGSTLTVVWQLSKLYLTETTGPTSVAKDVYIKPVQKKVQAHKALDGLEIESDVNAEDTLGAVQNVQSLTTVSTNEEELLQQHAVSSKYESEDLVSDKQQEDEDDSAAAAGAAESSFSPSQSSDSTLSGKKRKSSDGTSSTKKSSSSKKVNVSEDF